MSGRPEGHEEPPRPVALRGDTPSPGGQRSADAPCPLLPAAVSASNVTRSPLVSPTSLIDYAYPMLAQTQGFSRRFQSISILRVRLAGRVGQIRGKDPDSCFSMGRGASAPAARTRRAGQFQTVVGLGLWQPGRQTSLRLTPRPSLLRPGLDRPQAGSSALDQRWPAGRTRRSRFKARGAGCHEM